MAQFLQSDFPTHNQSKNSNLEHCTIYACLLCNIKSPKYSTLTYLAIFRHFYKEAFMHILFTVQLKGNLTHVDRAHAIYWLKAYGFINSYWHVWEGKPAKINFWKARMQAKKALSGYSYEYIPVPFSVYVHIYIVT